jgi:site-specific recombinase XerD
MAAYEAALGGQAAPIEVGASRTRPGTIAALTVAYFNSHEFQTLADSTKATYRNIIERIRAEHGDKRIALVQREHIVAMLNKRASTPAAANNWLRMVRMLMRLAITERLRPDDPTLTVKAVRTTSEGHEPWPDEEIERYRENHKLGTRARLAMEVLYATTMRRSDLVRVGRQNVRDGILSFKQRKTKVLVEIPLLAEARAAIDAVPHDHLTFLVTTFGKPFTANGFGNWFHDRCREAGIKKGLSAHGLRGAGATRLANEGCTDHQIMAWGGWTTLKEVQRYTRKANRRRLAQSAAEKLTTRTSSGKPQ